jgi:predicted acylesterase/phospholipase RssA
MFQFSKTVILLAGTAALSIVLLPSRVHAQRPATQPTATDTTLADAEAEPTTTQHALVLGGGSARGLAHGGALLALEQLGYDPPLVVGTSMGAIMGALYAAGYEPKQIWDVTGVEQWLARFSARPVAIGPHRVPVRPLLEVGIGAGRVYEGLVSGIGVNQRLVELLFDAGVRARNDFDRLPRRYRAVAADLATGEQIVLGAGDLPRAVRASMAVPGAFAPVVWGERVLIDGGVVNNLPVSVARSLTDLPIIAVDVIMPTIEIAERGALDVGVRGLRLLIANARPDTSSAADILVVPRLPPGLSAGGFPADATDRMRIGFDAVMEQVPPLSAPQSPGRRAAGAPPAAIGAVVIEGGDPTVARLAARLFAPAVGPYDPETVLRRMRALYATNLFQGVWPRLEFGDDDDTPATLVVDLAPAARTSVAGAADWDNDVGAAGWASLRHRLSLLAPIELSAVGLVSELDARASVDGSVFSGTMPGLIWNAGLHAGEARLRSIATDTAGRPIVRRAGGWAGAEMHGDVFVSILGRFDHVRDDDTGHDAWSAGPFVRVMPGPAPDRIVGVEPLLELEAWVLGATYQRARASVGTSRRIGATRTAVLADLALGSADTPRDALPAATRHLAPWLDVGALRARHRATVGVDIAHPLLLEGYARLRVRAIAATDDRDGLGNTRSWRAGAEIGAIWPTVIGPIEVGVAGGGGGWRLNAGVGR